MLWPWQTARSNQSERKVRNHQRLWTFLGTVVGSLFGGVLFLYAIRFLWREPGLIFISSHTLSNVPPFGALIGSFIGGIIAIRCAQASKQRRAIALAVILGSMAIASCFPQAEFIKILRRVREPYIKPIVYSVNRNHLTQLNSLANRNWMTDEDRSDALNSAVKLGNLKAVRILINASANVNEGT
ncbi:MAG: hypothetical protein AAFX40_17130, partial [Cyanobacteria bacterium J06639_1]